MDPDLNLGQSLGGLRIANPDTLSPASSSVSSRPHASPRSPETYDPKLGQPAIPTLPSSGLLRSPSPLDFNPRAFSTETTTLEPRAVAAGHLAPLEKPRAKETPSGHAQRQANRQSIPLTYQDQQQAQFPRYPTGMPISQRGSSAGNRPLSAVAPQTQPVRTNGESTYRPRHDPARQSLHGLPQRSSSRGAATAMQAGVAVNNDHQDRTYVTYNGSAPPRKSSRGMAGPQTPSGPNPYVVEPRPATAVEDRQDRGPPAGVRQEVTNAPQQEADPGKSPVKPAKKGVKDFQYGRVLGEGSYSTVIAATDRTNGKEYAIKVLDKRHILKEKKAKYVNIEKNTLNRLAEHPGVVRLYYTFQDEYSLYYVLDLAKKGELLGVLKETGTFDEECTRFYGAEILATIDHMHTRGVIHRDLKPENVLLDEKMHIKITDFGTAKLLNVPSQSGNDASDANPMNSAESDRANSFVGTAEYVSPELLTDKKACKASDLWAFGCIIYQLLAGRPPFKAANEYLTFQKIVALDYKFPQGFPHVARDLVERLLVLDPTSRLSIEHCKNHEFFRGVDWSPELWRLAAPRLKPYVPTPENLREATANDAVDNAPPNIAPAHSTHAKRVEGPGSSVPRPGPRVVTELPPPSQLDIEWSPVLTLDNERILKLGNLLVNTLPSPHSPSAKNGLSNGEADTPKKFSRFFGGGNSNKKRQRLVMVTSRARIIIVAAGGEEKKSKIEISLLAPGCSWNKLQDAKGFGYWAVDTQEKHFSFEDPKSATSDGSATSASAQEWLEIIERARELALSQNLPGSYSGEDALKESGHSGSRGMDLDAPPQMDGPASSNGRHILQKQNAGADDSFLGRKRFSKRQSKSGLAAVF